MAKEPTPTSGAQPSRGDAVAGATVRAAPEDDDAAKRAAEGAAAAQEPGGSDIGFWTVRSVQVGNALPDIEFGWTDRSGEPPPELLELRNRVDKTLGTLKLIFATAARRAQFDEAFGKLLSLAQLGLAGVDPATREANAALDSLQWEVLGREAGRIKNGYMITLGKWALAFAFVTTLVYFIFDQNPSFPPPELHAYRNLFLVLSGCMAGAWASFAGRRVVLTFFDLSALEDDHLDPAVRLIFTAVLTTILVLIFTTGFGDVRIGTFHASDVLRSGSTAVLIGALCGLAEKGLPAAVMMRASAFLNAAQGSSVRTGP